MHAVRAILWLGIALRRGIITTGEISPSPPPQKKKALINQLSHDKNVVLQCSNRSRMVTKNRGEWLKLEAESTPE